MLISGYHTEVAALERAYSTNESRIRSVVDELVSQREAIVHNSERLRTAIGGARETLSEAEDFAAEYDFAPLCFVAIPEAGTYSGEPFFGISRFAASTFGDNVEIQRDGAPIRIIGSVVAAQTTSPEPTPEIKVEVEIDNESISIVDVEEPDVESVNVDESLEIIDVIEEKEEFDESEVEVKAEKGKIIILQKKD